METVPAAPELTPAARRVLDAASDLFYERGIHAVGVDLVAETAGVTKKTLYARFGSKDALVVAYLQGRDRRWREFLEVFVAASDQAASDRAGTDGPLVVFDAAAAWSDEHSPRGCSAINARAETADLAAPVSREVTRQKVWLLGVLADLCRDAGVADPEGVARMLMLFYEGAIVTVGTAAFGEPFVVAREAARQVLAQAPRA
ncbi:transcriptional regulator, TetR family [Sanguibacter keddieii DSM 10542]|uniref:Transcriptional regulator, TetR family n=1 Tax=Sanguibacter keddieii (strain ATCC 51767 / DSM 10542 / NCFB 3025 / ST-74) TaxID=446469 RepID=D1BK66_SANKS|nr:TetR/AcrR family transcriptional regulator [Sanguibacter keddieii]ACZ20343.1 transcriptional regulator, TetR family [Sanguibacter keddieii DSM 10542]